MLNLIDDIYSVIVILFLSAAAWRDLAVRIIPDTFSLGILLAGIVRRAALGPVDLLASLSVAAVLFLMLVLLHARGLLGGGDVKIASAFAVGLHPLDIYNFVVMTTLIGGLLGAVYLIMARFMRVPIQCRCKRILVRVYNVELWRISRRQSLPYGVAIALAGLSVLLAPS